MGGVPRMIGGTPRRHPPRSVMRLFLAPVSRAFRISSPPGTSRWSRTGAARSASHPLHAAPAPKPQAAEADETASQFESATFPLHRASAVGVGRPRTVSSCVGILVTYVTSRTGG